MTCWQCRSEGARPYLGFMGRVERPWCDECAFAFKAQGFVLTLVERRAEDRPFRPQWLARLTARDETAA